MQRNAALVHVPADRAADLGLLGLLLVDGDDLQVNLPLGLSCDDQSWPCSGYALGSA